MLQYVGKGKDMSKPLVAFVLVGFFLFTNPVFAEMTSTNYQIRWDSLSEGGSDSSTSESYGLHDSIGGNALGDASSESYDLESGYRAGIFSQVLTFDVLLQNSSGSRAVASRSGTTVSLSDTSGLAAGGYIGLIQDEGASQVSAVGRIVSVSSGVSVTVDAWSHNGTIPTIDGTNDVLVRLNGSSLSFGELSATRVATTLMGFAVTADLDSGYSIQVMVDGGLTNGTHALTSVADGAVTLGTEEYGGISSDTSVSTSTFDTEDSAFSTTFQDLVTVSSEAYQDRHFLTLKAAASSETPTGTYSQAMTVIASGHF